MVGKLEGKVAIVTGGSGGFGLGITHKFVNEGAKVVILDINAEGGKKAERDNPGSKFVKGDVSTRKSWEEALETALKEFGRLDIVVNCAGILIVKLTTEFTEEEYERLFRVNVKSIFQSSQVIIPHLAKNGGGSIINISSSGDPRPRPEGVWYGATKAAVSNATRALAAEWAKYNIRVNSIAPSLADTGLMPAIIARAGMPNNEETRTKMTAVIPLGRLCKPSDIGNACCFLASDEADYITGAQLGVDGGRAI